MAYLIRRRDDSERLKYYAHLDGRHGIPARAKKEAPRFDEEMAGRIIRQLVALDNRDWEMFEDKPKVKKEPKARKSRGAQEEAVPA